MARGHPRTRGRQKRKYGRKPRHVKLFNRQPGAAPGAPEQRETDGESHYAIDN